jgi:hypothetical protein
MLINDVERFENEEEALIRAQAYLLKFCEKKNEISPEKTKKQKSPIKQGNFKG